MPITPNTTLAHYTILSKIGAGGMVHRSPETRRCHKCFEGSVRADPNYDAAYIHLGYLCGKKRYREGIAAYEKGWNLKAVSTQKSKSRPATLGVVTKAALDQS